MPVKFTDIRLLTVVTITVLSVVLLPRAEGQDKQPGTIKVAVVDFNRAASEYNYTITSEKKFKDDESDIITEMTSWDQHSLLAEADQRALSQIAIKEDHKTELTAGEKAAKTKLEDDTRRLFDEQLADQTAQPPTPAQQDRLKEFTKLKADTKTRIEARRVSGKAQLDKESNDIQVKINKDVHEAIDKLAKEKGYTQVFSNQVLLYCENDITDDVIKKLNSGKQ